MNKTSKSQRLKVGGVFVISLQNGMFSYGRILEKSSIAIYDYFPSTVNNDLNSIVSNPVLFILAVYNEIIKKRGWEVIGYLPLEEKLKVVPMKFIQDALQPELYSLYDPNTGEIIPTTKEKCFGLERSSVWAKNHVEERILDHINRVPNRWLERNRIAVM